MRFRKNSGSPLKDFNENESKGHFKSNTTFIKADLQHHKIKEQINQLNN